MWGAEGLATNYPPSICCRWLNLRNEVKQRIQGHDPWTACEGRATVRERWPFFLDKFLSLCYTATRALIMAGLDPFDMDMDRDLDGMDFLGFHFRMQHRPVPSPLSKDMRWVIPRSVLAIPAISVWTVAVLLLLPSLSG